MQLIKKGLSLSNPWHLAHYIRLQGRRRVQLFSIVPATASKQDDAGVDMPVRSGIAGRVPF